MAKKEMSVAKVFRKLREVDVLNDQGQCITQACRKARQT